MSGNQYEAVFTNTAGIDYRSAPRSPSRPRPVVTTQTDQSDGQPGRTATFTAAASGTPTPSVQWKVSTGDGVQLSDGGQL